jgi:hypothetical protein
MVDSKDFAVNSARPGTGFDSHTIGVKDKHLAGVGVVLLLTCYLIILFNGFDPEFIENCVLVMLGTFAGLLKASMPVPPTTVSDSGPTIIERPQA